MHRICLPHSWTHITAHLDYLCIWMYWHRAEGTLEQVLCSLTCLAEASIIMIHSTRPMLFHELKEVTAVLLLRKDF